VEKCPGGCISDIYEGDIEGFVLSKEHNHQPQSVGASIREKMLRKGRGSYGTMLKKSLLNF
jgi:hypothetical protein